MRARSTVSIGGSVVIGLAALAAACDADPAGSGDQPSGDQGISGYVEVTPPASGVEASADDGNVAANTVDSKLSTRWSVSGDGAFITYDLGATRTVGYVTVAVYQGDQRRNIFDLQTSTNATTWTTVFSGRSSGTTTAEQIYDFPDVSARFVRYLGHGNDRWGSVREIAAPAS